jgi:Subtilase family
VPDYPHFILPGNGQPEEYTARGGGRGTFRSPPRDRPRHAQSLLDQLRGVRHDADQRLAEQPATTDLHFIPIAFESAAGHELALESLENKTARIRVVNVKTENEKQIATLAVPRDKIEHFEKRFTEYAEEDRVKEAADGTEQRTPYHQKLVTSINELRLAALRDYYMDSDGQPPGKTEVIWWEVWLDTAAVASAVEDFRAEAGGKNIPISENTVRFPEVAVVLARTSFDGWSQFPGLLNLLAELRRASIVPSEFTMLPPSDQSEFVEALRERTQYSSPDAPAVCLLDTGVNRGHRLLESALSPEDAQTWKPDWGVFDVKGHGTEQAGLALFGPLEGILLEDDAVALAHRLESVKILPDSGENDPPDYGPITVGAMAMAELQSPMRPRTFCLTITADDRDQGLPTLWSAAIDQACSGAQDESRRLLVVSAGNLKSDIGVNYPDTNHLASVQDPAQSWNSLTVGACTSKVWLQEEGLEGWTPVAPKGRLSPASTTSIAWEAQEWPLKPDVVFEGGNYATDQSGFVTGADDLSLLTTRLDESGAQLGVSRDTSAAAAQVARIGAILQSDYPELWPETIRGLLVHSAEWSSEMLEEFPYRQRNARLRCYGWGIPNLQRARSCAKNIATLIFEDSLRPFRKVGHEVKSYQMNVHPLPFPANVLQQLGDDDVTMRVTLSYFVEPSPGRKGWTKRHRYASHGLRFDVIRPDEDLSQFRTRLTRDVWEDRSHNPGGAVPDSREWQLGDDLRRKGCLHSDFWTGTASTLALCDKIAVFPVTGWWRERPGLERFDRDARYSLLVTITSKQTEVDLYVAVEQAIAVQPTVAVPTDAEP